MLRRNSLFFPLIFGILICSTCQGLSILQHAKNINEMNLNLPVIYDTSEDRQIHFKMTATNGCYAWYSSKPQIVTVAPYEDPDEVCHDSAIIRLNIRKPFSEKIWIAAKDIDTGDILNCETQVSEIHLLEITTHLEGRVDVGNYRVLKVVAKNKNNVMLSTLEGVNFEWTSNNTDVIKLILLKVSPFFQTIFIYQRILTQIQL